MEHTFSVLAAIIERNAAFLVALNQLVAQFMPPPQFDSSPPEQAWQQDPWQQRKSRRRNAGSQETEQSTSHGTESTAASRSMEVPLPQEWPLPGATPKKRRRSPLTARDAEGSTPILTPPQTVVLRSIGKKEVSAFTGQEIREAVKQAGIDNMEGYTVHRNEKANAIAITTRDPLMVEKLLQVREIQKGEETLPLQPYKALAGNHCRGVIYLPGQGNTVTPESLREDIDCRDHKVAAARPIGAKGNTILVTFEGRVLPKKVRYMCEVLDVREYRPRPLVCFRCHGIGHKMDVCPRGSACCGTCGSEHDDVQEVVSTQVKLGDTVIDVHNTYIMPSVGANNADWINRLVEPKRHTILAGDFNARRTAWGYPDKNARGKNIKKACENSNLQLCNNPDTPTRLAQNTNHNDTSPDLAWTSPKLRIKWQVLQDAMGSDHLPIRTDLLISTLCVQASEILGAEPEEPVARSSRVLCVSQGKSLVGGNSDPAGLS
ncbi:hypothetical protein IscW_ISCW004910 [Ixodes scapularis]|uniref:Endonuclease/exonuclease/phosphatase domain-containing protein n=1 Tax=Ixodes scapularis TaxID=6945 RepID=B7PJV5_IXOSC|nr:hypothetical protein IscW_ISCW004910 [Ixodes scapularis]|eukprot:XP_002408709.1 hypothetical protein IscW_ISCW004910 [Ixodes scapularis]